jgi:hypothetical protein
LAVEAFTLAEVPGGKWYRLPAGHYLQGCLVGHVVWCVDAGGGRPRMVRGTRVRTGEGALEAPI